MTRVLCGARYCTGRRLPGTFGTHPIFGFLVFQPHLNPYTQYQMRRSVFQAKEVMVEETLNFPALHFNLQED